MKLYIPEDGLTIHAIYRGKGHASIFIWFLWIHIMCFCGRSHFSCSLLGLRCEQPACWLVYLRRVSRYDPKQPKFQIGYDESVSLIVFQWTKSLEFFGVLLSWVFGQTWCKSTLLCRIYTGEEKFWAIFSLFFICMYIAQMLEKFNSSQLLPSKPDG